MTGRFEDLWNSAADDGASTPLGIFSTGSNTEVGHLMDAWFRERTDRIEYALLLDEAQRLIANLLADGEITPKRRRQAGRLLRICRKVRGSKGSH